MRLLAWKASRTFRASVLSSVQPFQHIHLMIDAFTLVVSHAWHHTYICRHTTTSLTDASAQDRSLWQDNTYPMHLPYQLQERHSLCWYIADTHMQQRIHTINHTCKQRIMHTCSQGIVHTTIPASRGLNIHAADESYIQWYMHAAEEPYIQWYTNSRVIHTRK